MYPLSSNVQRPAAAEYLVEEALKTQSPELFVFELRMYTYEEGDMMDNMAYARPEKNLLDIPVCPQHISKRAQEKQKEYGKKY